MGFFILLCYFIPYCVRSVRIWSFSGPYFPTFALNTERYGASFRVQSECGKMRTRKTPNTDIFHAVKSIRVLGLQIWNKLLETLKAKRSFQAFKRSLSDCFGPRSQWKVSSYLDNTTVPLRCRSNLSFDLSHLGFLF